MKQSESLPYCFEEEDLSAKCDQIFLRINPERTSKQPDQPFNGILSQLNGKNDELILSFGFGSLRVEEFSLFNRWGSLLYRSEQHLYPTKLPFCASVHTNCRLYNQ